MSRPLDFSTGLESVKLFIRPEDIYINHESSHKAKLIKSHFRGPGRFHTFELPSGNQLTCLDKCPKRLELNLEYGISVCDAKVTFFIKKLNRKAYSGKK